MALTSFQDRKDAFASAQGYRTFVLLSNRNRALFGHKPGSPSHRAAVRYVFSGAEDGMDEVIRRFSEEVFTIHLSGRFILFVIFLGIAGFLRRLYISGGKDWQKVFIATAPSLKEGPSPIDTVLKGTIGCLKAIIALFLVIICIILAIDAIALNSEILIQILNQLP